MKTLREIKRAVLAQPGFTAEPQRPTCPNHPDSPVQWSGLRETWRCSTCRQPLPDPSADPHLGVNDVL